MREERGADPRPACSAGSHRRPAARSAGEASAEASACTQSESLGDGVPHDCFSLGLPWTGRAQWRRRSARATQSPDECFAMIAIGPRRRQSSAGAPVASRRHTGTASGPRHSDSPMAGPEAPGVYRFGGRTARRASVLRHWGRRVPRRSCNAWSAASGPGRAGRPPRRRLRRWLLQIGRTRTTTTPASR